MAAAKMSAAVLITISSNLASFISFILFCIFYSWIITLQDFYSCFRRIFNLLSYILLNSWKSCRRLSSKNIAPHDGDSNLEPCLKIGDVEIVMEKLGLVKEQLMLQASLEIVDMFDDRDVSLVEVREAFWVFDENNDGYIDAVELNKVMSSLGLVGLSEQECQRMIMAFDDDGDGMIDFGEFLKLI